MRDSIQRRTLWPLQRCHILGGAALIMLMRSAGDAEMFQLGTMQLCASRLVCALRCSTCVSWRACMCTSMPEHFLENVHACSMYRCSRSALAPPRSVPSRRQWFALERRYVQPHPCVIYCSAVRPIMDLSRISKGRALEVVRVLYASISRPRSTRNLQLTSLMASANQVVRIIYIDRRLH